MARWDVDILKKMDAIRYQISEAYGAKWGLSASRIPNSENEDG